MVSVIIVMGRREKSNSKSVFNVVSLIIEASFQDKRFHDQLCTVQLLPVATGAEQT